MGSMNLRMFIHIGCVLTLLAALAPSVHAEDVKLSEKEKIEALITSIEGLKDAKFVRNGSVYDSKTAGKFLRARWKKFDKEIKAATDFITTAANRSSSGKPYLIRFKDNSEVTCADYLTAELKKLEANGKQPPQK